MSKYHETEDKIAIEWGNKMVVLILRDFEEEIDVDDLTKIQHHNIMGELITASVALNRVGNLVALAEDALAHAKLDFEIFKAQMEEEKRKELTFETTDSKGNAKISKPSNPEVDAAVIRSPQYRVKKKEIFKREKEYKILNSLYWAIKSKDDKLNTVIDKLSPDEFEFEVAESRINGIMIRVRDKAIK